jgi:Sortilin, neurotensin receptor 3,
MFGRFTIFRVAVLLALATGPVMAAQGSWTEVSTGPGVGAVFAIAVDPSTPTTIYAGTETGGARKSMDGGATWSDANGATLTDPWVEALVVAPTTPPTIYAGTGASGVFRSTDGGLNWTQVNAGLDNLVVQALVVHPTNPAILYAGTEGGVFKSTDGGATWVSRSSGISIPDVRALAIHPSNPETIYAGTAMGISGRPFFVTTDGGASWTAPGSPGGGGGPGGSVLAIDVDDDGAIIIAAGGVLRSTNGGALFSIMQTPPGVVPGPVLPTTGVVAARDATRVYSSRSTGGVFRHRTQVTETGVAMNDGLAAPNVVTLVDDPTGGTLFAGTASGGVASFILPVTDIAVSLERQAETAIGGTSTTHTLRVTNNGPAPTFVVLDFPINSGPNPTGAPGVQLCRPMPPASRCVLTVTPGTPQVYPLTWAIPFTFSGLIATEVRAVTEEREVNLTNNQSSAQTTAIPAPMLALPPSGKLPTGTCRLPRARAPKPGKRAVVPRCRPVVTFQLTGPTSVRIILRRGKVRLGVLTVQGSTGTNRVVLPKRVVGRGLKRGRYNVEFRTLSGTATTSGATIQLVAKRP